MSFQFVNVTPDNTEHDAETRRRIRSQAMRNYRRQQRLEEEEGSNPSSPEESPSSLSPQQSSASNSRQESRRRKSSTQSLSFRPEGPRRGSSGASRDSLPDIRDLEVAKGKRRSSSSAFKDSLERGLRRQKRTDEPREQRGTFGQFSVNLPKPSKPPSFSSGDVDPLSTPDLLEQMLSICDTYNRWLMSNTPSEPKSTQTSGPWDNPTSQMLLFSLCLKSIGHMDALKPGQMNDNKMMFKTRVLALARKRLKNPAKALEDKTIGALACLASYEVSRGSKEAEMHMKGLSQIVKLRGGTDKIGQKGGLYMFLEILDLIHAVYFHSFPKYTSPDRSPPSSNEDTPHLQTWDGTAEIDQELLDDLSNFISSIPEMEDWEDPLTDTSPAEPPSTLLAFEVEVDQWHQYLIQAERSIAPSYGGALAYACGLAAGLHLITSSAVAAHPTRVQVQTDELFKAMSNLPDNAWDNFHMLHIRILLTALSTARNLSQKSWYNAHLTRRLYQTELESWGAIKGLMWRFIEMRSATSQPRTQAVRASVNGIEIVVNAAEAQQRGLAVRTLPHRSHRPASDSFNMAEKKYLTNNDI